MSPERLVHMVNQIGQFFITQDASRGRSRAAEAIAEHLKKFWDPRMRADICRYVAGGGGGLDPEARQAVALLAAPDPQPVSPQA